MKKKITITGLLALFISTTYASAPKGEKMPQENERSQIISHALHQGNLETIVEAAKKRILAEGDKPYASANERLALLTQLAKGPFGKFCLQNKGLNGYWTNRLVLYPQHKASGREESSPDSLDPWLFENAPSCLSTQERFTIFQAQLQKYLKEGGKAASVPCGLMDDLLTLDTKDLKAFRFDGFDSDPESLELAKASATEKGLTKQCTFHLVDAWKISQQNVYDVLTSNGLNIYVKDDAKVIALYKVFYQMLEPGGVLITSFLTPGPAINPNSPWKMDVINQENLRIQRIIFTDLIQAGWQQFRTHEQTRAMLEEAGFINIEFIDDSHGMFPTVVARKAE